MQAFLQSYASQSWCGVWLLVMLLVSLFRASAQVQAANYLQDASYDPTNPVFNSTAAHSPLNRTAGPQQMTVQVATFFIQRIAYDWYLGEACGLLFFSVLYLWFSFQIEMCQKAQCLLNDLHEDPPGAFPHMFSLVGL